MNIDRKYITEFIASCHWTMASLADPEASPSGHDPEEIEQDEQFFKQCAQCELFVRHAEKSLLAAYNEHQYDADQAGCDFALTRNGHGAGFWDRGLGDIGELLTGWCEPFGTSYLYTGDDGKLYYE